MDVPREITTLPVKSQENPNVSTVKEKTSSENSEYDSVESYSDQEEQPVNKARSKASGLDSHSDSEERAVLKREEGDGQESVPQKKVDDDEDKKNPQYIPKRGTFYEHDDRTAEDNIENHEEADPEKADKDGKKKVWQDKKEKWTHDRFNDQEQAPKSRAELISIYGYDIRNEDGPPRARRQRRYGRGPNKYTRNWEDEDAYTKPPPIRPQRSIKKQPRSRDTNNTEEFPPLGGGNNRSRTKSVSSDSNQEEDFKENNEVQQVQQHQKPIKTNKEQYPNNSQQEAHQSTEQTGNNRARIGTGRVVKPKKEIKDSDYMGFTSKTRQERGVRTDNQQVLPPRGHFKRDTNDFIQSQNNFKRETNDFIQSQNFTNKNNTQTNQIAALEKDIAQLNIQDGVYKGSRNNVPNNNRQGSVPPRLQNTEPKGPKRYSSMRQRSLPETNAPPVPPNFSFYPTDYNSTAPPPATQQPLLPTPLPPGTTLVPPQVPVSAAPPPLLQAPFPPPAAFAAPPPPQAYLQAPPPPFIAAPPAQPQIVSYVTQAQPPYVQGFQGQFNAVTQPAELYQPQGGITYYSADQQIVQRPVPQKRPKAAIPIVAPTDFNELYNQNREELQVLNSAIEAHEVQE